MLKKYFYHFVKPLINITKKTPAKISNKSFNSNALLGITKCENSKTKEIQ